MQIFQLPFVNDNVHRYHTEFKKHLMKQSSTMVKRKQMLEQGLNSINQKVLASRQEDVTGRVKEVCVRAVARAPVKSLMHGLKRFFIAVSFKI